MARKGGKRGGSSAARSAAAKKGWETRRRGGAKSKPAATKRTAASKAKPTAKRGGMPKTTSARGRALTNQRRAADLVRASRAGKGPSAKAVRSVLTAQRARAFYAATGGGKKRSAVKAKSAAKVGKSIRAESRAKATAARAKVAGRPRSRVVAKPAAQRQAAKLGFTQSDFQRRSQRTTGIRNPRVRETAQRLYGRVLDLGSSPRQLRTMFKKAGKPKAGRKSVAQRQSQREHRDMLALANRLF